MISEICSTIMHEDDVEKIKNINENLENMCNYLLNSFDLRLNNIQQFCYADVVNLKYYYNEKIKLYESYFNSKYLLNKEQENWLECSIKILKHNLVYINYIMQKLDCIEDNIKSFQRFIERIQSNEKFIEDITEKSNKNPENLEGILENQLHNQLMWKYQNPDKEVVQNDQ